MYRSYTHTKKGDVIMLNNYEIFTILLCENNSEKEKIINTVEKISLRKQIKYNRVKLEDKTEYSYILYSESKDKQYIFESIMFSAMALYHSGKSSKSRLIEAHRRFETQINNKIEEKMSRTMELNNIKAQALKELGFTEMTEENGTLILEKMAEIESRKTAFRKIEN